MEKYDHVERSQQLKSLLEVKDLIDGTLQGCAQDLLRLKASKFVSPNELIKLSMQIRYNTHAPREFKIGFPLVNGHPPAPQPEEMRNSILATYNSRQAATFNDTTENNKRNSQGETFVSQLRIEMASFQAKKFEQNLKGHNNIEVESTTSNQYRHEETTSEPQMPQNKREGLDDHVQVKRARTVNISFASYDSDNDDWLPTYRS